MYSPNICEQLIPVLYRVSKARHMPMTKLVDALLFKALASEELPEDATAMFAAIRNAEQNIEKEAA